MQTRSHSFVSSNSLWIKFGCYLLVVAMIIPLLQHHVAIFGYFGLGGLFVNDSLGMASNLLLFAQGEDIKYTGILGVLFIYYPSYYFGGLYNLVINCTMLSLATLFFLKTLFATGICATKRHISFLFFIVIANFYIIEVLFYPNKEIPLIFLTNVFLYYAIIQKAKLVSFVILLLSLLVRDAHGIMLLLIYSFIFFAPHLIVRHPIRILFVIFSLFCLISIRIISELQLLGDFNYILDRNIALANNPDSALSDSILNTLPSYVSFPIKVFNNAVGSALRPQFFDSNDRLYLHGIGLWQLGLVILFGGMTWLYLLFKARITTEAISIGFSILLAFLVVSAGSYTQARYLLPFIYWLAVVPIIYIRLTFLIGMVSTLTLITLALSVLGYGAPIPLGIDVDPMFY